QQEPEPSPADVREGRHRARPDGEAQTGGVEDDGGRDVVDDVADADVLLGRGHGALRSPRRPAAAGHRGRGRGSRSLGRPFGSGPGARRGGRRSSRATRPRRDTAPGTGPEKRQGPVLRSGAPGPVMVDTGQAPGCSCPPPPAPPPAGAVGSCRCSTVIDPATPTGSGGAISPSSRPRNVNSPRSPSPSASTSMV